MTDGYLWNEANVSHPDMKGTAQIDIASYGRSIEEIVGLDAGKWMVIGIDIGGGPHGHSLRVVALDRSLFPDDASDVLPQIADAHGGEIPATDFLIHDFDPYELLREVGHVFHFNMRVRRISEAGIPVRVVDEADIPIQD